MEPLGFLYSQRRQLKPCWKPFNNFNRQLLRAKTFQTRGNYNRKMDGSSKKCLPIGSASIAIFSQPGQSTFNLGNMPKPEKINGLKGNLRSPTEEQRFAASLASLEGKPSLNVEKTWRFSLTKTNRSCFPISFAGFLRLAKAIHKECRQETPAAESAVLATTTFFFAQAHCFKGLWTTRFWGISRYPLKKSLPTLPTPIESKNSRSQKYSPRKTCV